MRIALLIAMMTFSQVVSADYWRTSANTLLVVDWLQTRYIADNPDKHGEINPIMGKHPSMGEVNAYFLGSAIVMNLIGEYALDSPDKKTFYVFITGMETLAISNNIKLGIKLRF
jgi:hypothetical protein